MPDGVVAYRRGYKYQLCDTFEQTITITPPFNIHSEWIQLSDQGRLTIFKGYAWDGASGPTRDVSLVRRRPTSIRGSLIHDALYQLMREQLLGLEYRSLADHLLYQCCLEDGMLKPRAWVWWQAVRWGAGPAARPSGCNPVLYAP